MTTMKAVRLFEFGEPDKLVYGEHPMPEVGPGDVLVKVLATSVSRWDIKYRTGEVHAFYGKATGHHGGIHGRRAFRCRCSSGAMSPARWLRWARA
jgi:NADPH:quinone reductase-like Zn-dependent oxidoreductase